MKNEQVDVASLDSGLAGSVLAALHQWGNPTVRHLDFLPEKLMRMIGWGKTEAPEPIQRMFDFDP